MYLPKIGGGYHEVFRECAVAAAPNADSQVAQVPLTGAAVPAQSAVDVALGGHTFAWFEAVDTFTDGGDFADKFVPDDARYSDVAPSPVVPFVNVQVGATDPGLVDFYQDLVGSHAGHWRLLQPDAGFPTLLDQGLHGCLHQL